MPAPSTGCDCGGIIFSDCCPSVRPSDTIFHKPLGEVNQIYIFGALGNKDEVIRFWGQKVKGKGHSQTRYGQKDGCIAIHQPLAVDFYVGLVLG